MGEQAVVIREKKLSGRQEAPGPGEEQAERASPGTMLFRSTGLGRAELVGKIVGIKRQGDYLIMELLTTQPVRWKIRGALSHRDLRTLLKAMAKISILGFLLNLRGWFKQPTHPGDF